MKYTIEIEQATTEDNHSIIFTVDDSADEIGVKVGYYDAKISLEVLQKVKALFELRSKDEIKNI